MKEMGFLDHLEELRRTLFWVIGTVMVATIVTWFFSGQIVDLLLRPAREAGQETLYFHAPMEAFLLKLKASLVVGVLVGFPLILYRIYMFVLPGLLPKEKRVVTPLLLAATLLFYVGVLFCFLILLPMVIRFALGFATESMQPWLTVDAYFGMTARLCLAFGLLFELPMVVFALTWARVVQPKTLLKGWRWALVTILAASAILTPPDIISQVMLAGPVMLLYLASVLVSMIVRRNEEKGRKDVTDGDDDPSGPEGGDGGGSRPTSTPSGQPPEAPELPLWDSGPEESAPGGGGQPENPRGPEGSSSADPPDVRPASGTRARGDHDTVNDAKTDD
jgi:sec-independent protein translocase protein TatC